MRELSGKKSDQNTINFVKELKFCAYLKIHLSTNQIAAIFNVTIEAIRKTRYRIRKKLNLPPEESLEDYISKF